MGENGVWDDIINLCNIGGAVAGGYENMHAKKC